MKKISSNKNGVVYIRISTDEQTTVLQEKHVKSFAEENNINILKTFIDEDKSGYTSDRPGFHDMIEYIKTCNKPEEREEYKIQYIVCYDIARISRSIEMITYFPFFGKLGVVIVTSSNKKFYTGFLDDDPEKIFLEAIETLFSFYEGKKTRKRNSDGYDIRRLEAIENGESWGRPRKQLNLSQEKILLMLRSKKFSKQQTANIAGISKSTLTNYLKEWGCFEEFRRKINENSIKNLLNVSIKNPKI